MEREISEWTTTVGIYIQQRGVITTTAILDGRDGHFKRRELVHYLAVLLENTLKNLDGDALGYRAFFEITMEFQREKKIPDEVW